MTFSVSKHGMLDMSKGKISLMSKKLGLKKLMKVEFSLTLLPKVTIQQ